jgi:hypothetical protein
MGWVFLIVLMLAILADAITGQHFVPLWITVGFVAGSIQSRMSKRFLRNGSLH